jgi:hypothetical protein
MLAFLAHHGIDANPHDTGLQLHDQIMKELGTELGHDPSRIQNQSRKKNKSPKPMPRCQRRRSKWLSA